MSLFFVFLKRLNNKEILQIQIKIFKENFVSKSINILQQQNKQPRGRRKLLEISTWRLIVLEKDEEI